MADNLIKRIRTDKGDCKIDYNSLANRPSSMKNPYALTFSGAASSSYDGTVPVNVRIPPIPTWADQDTNPSYTKSESDNKYATKQESDEKYAPADQTYTKDETDARYAPISAAIRPTVTGNPAVCENSAAWRLQGLKIYGKSTQNGEPSPENPVPIVSAGENGNIDLNFLGTNRMNYTLVPSNGVIARCNVSLNKSVFSVTPTSDAELCFGGLIMATSEIGKPYSGNKSLLFSVVPGEKLKIVASNPYFDTNYFCFVDKSFISLKSVGATGTVEVPENAAFATARLGRKSAKITDGTQYTTFMVCREEHTGDFVPYKSQALTLSTPNGLPGIPVESGGNFTDADGQQLVCDVKDYGTGKYTQNCKKAVFDGSDDENWRAGVTYFPDKFRCICDAPQLAKVGVNNMAVAPVLCDKFKATSAGNESSGTFGGQQGVAIGSSGTLMFYSDDFNSSDISAWKNWLKTNPIEVVYQVETPIETDISAEELAAYRALTTYDGTTVVSTAEDVAGIEASYVADGTKYLQSVTDRIAALEAAQTSI